MRQRVSIAFWLSFLGGLWMLAAGRMMPGRWTHMRGWGLHPMPWGREIMGFGSAWPWLGTLAGAIVIICAIALMLAPQYRRSLGTTILVISLLHLAVGMGGLLGSVLGSIGGVVALLPKPASPDRTTMNCLFSNSML